MVEIDVLREDTKECVDHLMVVKDVVQQPEPDANEARILRRAGRKRKRGWEGIS